MDDLELWRPIPGYSNYEASSLGRIRSLRGKRNSNGTFRPGRMLKIFLHNGYPVLRIWNDGKAKSFKVHRLMMFAFYGVSTLHVNHKNGIKTDNRLENLEYVTPAENNRHAYAIGLKHAAKGESNPNAKLTSEKVKEIRSSTKTHKELAQIYGVDKSIIHDVKTYKSWKHV